MGFKKKDNQNYYNPLRRAVLNHQMIEPGDKVAVGMSGGKDSTTLLYLLDRIRRQRRLGFDFEIVPISLDMGFEGCDITPMKQFVESLGYQLEIVPTNIAKSFLIFVKKSRLVRYVQSYVEASCTIELVN